MGRAAAVVVVVALVWVAPAGATLPGRNGAIGLGVEQCGAGCDKWLGAVDERGRTSRVLDPYGVTSGLSRPAFAPGGRRFAANHFGEVTILRVRGDGQERRVKTPRGSDGCAASWAPDGRQLVISVHFPDDRASLYRVSRSGKLLGRIGTTYRSVTDCASLAPDWSARGEIAYSEPGPQQPDHGLPLSSGIRAIRADGSRLRALTNGRDDEASWSPSGRTVAFQRSGARPLCGAIHLVRRDGHGLRTLTSGYCDTDPAWSPDGKSVVFVRAGRDLYRIDADGRSIPRRLLRGAPETSIGDPAWQPLAR